ncbi:unnamed protein product [Caenorhabditis nigoni]
MKIDNKPPILEMIPPIENVGNPKIEVTVCRNLTGDIIDAVRVTKDDGTEGWLKVMIKEHDVDEKFRRNVNFHDYGYDVIAETIATMPKNLPGIEKFQGKIWSQYLGFLRDTKNKFTETMCGDELGWVTVKYAPDGDTVFEITDVVQNYAVNLDEEKVLPTPWSPEYTE